MSSADLSDISSSSSETDSGSSDGVENYTSRFRWDGASSSSSVRLERKSADLAAVSHSLETGDPVPCLRIQETDQTVDDPESPGFEPKLIDEEEGDRGALVEEEVGFAEPSYSVPARRVPDGMWDHIGPSKTCDESMWVTYKFCKAPKGLRYMIPEPDDRPWTPPEGFVCVYEAFFTHCGLRFPIPALLSQFCAKHEIALSQLSPAAIRNAVGLMRLGEECGVDVSYEFFEELTTLKPIPNGPGLFYCTAAANHKIVVGQKAKTNRWKNFYFFVEKNDAAFEDLSVTYYDDWRLRAGRRSSAFF